MRRVSWVLMALGCFAVLLARAENVNLVEGSFAPAKSAAQAPDPAAPLVESLNETVPLPLPEPQFPFESQKRKETPRGEIVFVERRVANTDEEKPSKEYYLNVGKMDDVKVGDVFHVFRDVSVVDVTVGEPLEFIPVKIAEIQVTTLGESTCVGRLLGMVDPRSLPKLDYAVIMVGDRVKRKVGLPFASNS